MKWRMFLIGVLIVVAGLSLFARRERPDELPTIRPAVEPPQPGYFMTGADIVQTGADGKPLYRVRAERIQQDPDDLTVTLHQLRLDYEVAAPAGGPAPRWNLTAKTGHMSPDATRIELVDDVQIKGQPQLGAKNLKAVAPATIRTSKLVVDLQTNTASTRERVDIVWGKRQLSAVGLFADLKAERVKLESAVHGRFVY